MEKEHASEHDNHMPRGTDVMHAHVMFPHDKRFRPHSRVLSAPLSLSGKREPEYQAFRAVGRGGDKGEKS